MITIDNLDIAATWDDVLSVGHDSREELEKFTRDTLVEVIINDAATGFSYELTLDGVLYTYPRQAGETNADVAANWITELSNQRALFYKFVFAIGDDFNDTIAVKSRQELIFLPVSVGANMELRESSESGKPLKYGGRSNILLEVARRCKLAFYNTRLGDAQKYLAAHFAFQSLLPPEGRGTISSEAFDGESTSWLIPKLNPKANEEEPMSIVGTRFLRIRSSRTVRYRRF